MQLEGIDLIIFGVYIIGVILFGIWIANREKATTASDYFLASRSLPWWAVGGSLIASNISAEQIIGMNGSGFEIGLAIATYELMAAITLIMVAKFLLPVFLKKEIYTMPQFLEERYDSTVRTIMSVFWIILFVFVNIATVLYLGALAMERLLDAPAIVEAFGGNAADWTAKELSDLALYIGILALVLYSACFSIFGGLKAVVWTDVIQVVVLLIGGTVAAWGILSYVGDGSVLTGIANLWDAVPGHFNMLFSPQDDYVSQATYTEILKADPTLSMEAAKEAAKKSSYELLPGFAVLFGGMWIVNTYYWGNNQYIIQRALASKSLPEAQKGVAFAALMKLFIPFFAVLPGIAAYYLMTKQDMTIDISKADQIFPWVLENFSSPGFRGITYAAIVAAIGSSVSSMVNSASTIFTIDIYNKFIDTSATEKKQVRIGQWAAGGALVIGALMAPALAGAGQVFQVIQEYTGFISPGVFTVFIFGMFYRKGTAKAALAVVLLSVPLSVAFKFLMPGLPFLDRMAAIFLISSILMIVLSSMTSKSGPRSAVRTLDADLTQQPSSVTADKRKEMVSRSTLRNGLALTIIAVGVATAIRLLLQPIDPNPALGVTGVPSWAVYVFVLLSGAALALVYTDKQPDDHKAIDLEKSLFKTRLGFNVSAIAIILILAVLYGFLA